MHCKRKLPNFEMPKVFHNPIKRVFDFLIICKYIFLNMIFTFNPCVYNVQLYKIMMDGCHFPGITDIMVEYKIMMAVHWLTLPRDH